VRRIGVLRGAEDRDRRILDRRRVAARRRLHRRRRDHLHEVVDDDVAQRADRVVEVAAVLDAEALGHRDLHRGHVVAVPDRLEHRVGEAQVERLDQAHLPEEMVDPVQLGLVEVLMDLVVERAGGGEVVAERLLDDDTRVLGEPRAGEAADHAAEQKGRDLEVEHGARGVAEHLGEPLVGRRVGEVAVQIGHPRGQAREDGAVERLAGSRDRRAGMRAQVVLGPVVDGDADDRAVEQPAPLEPVQRAERHDLGEVARDPEDHEDVGRGGVAAVRARPRLRFGCGGHTAERSRELASGVITRWG
jgi:hypothetical protein